MGFMVQTTGTEHCDGRDVRTRCAECQEISRLGMAGQFLLLPDAEERGQGRQDKLDTSGSCTTPCAVVALKGAGKILVVENYQAAGPVAAWKMWLPPLIPAH